MQFGVHFLLVNLYFFFFFKDAGSWDFNVFEEKVFDLSVSPCVIEPNFPFMVSLNVAMVPGDQLVSCVRDVTI